MIFIKNKKEWKAVLKDSKYCNNDMPKSFPLWVYDQIDGEGDVWLMHLYAEDLKLMVEKIEKGREF